MVPNILMMVGLASIGTNWVASRVCQDSLDASRFPRWKAFLLAWFVVATLLCFLLLAVVVLSYALQGSLEESLKVGSLGMIMNRVWQNHSHNINLIPCMFWRLKRQPSVSIKGWRL